MGKDSFRLKNIKLLKKIILILSFCLGMMSEMQYHPNLNSPSRSTILNWVTARTRKRGCVDSPLVDKGKTYSSSG